MLDYLRKQLHESEEICERCNNIFTEYNRLKKEYELLKKEYELLKEELKELKDGISGVYNNMNALEIINKKELEEDIEEI